MPRKQRNLVLQVIDVQRLTEDGKDLGKLSKGEDVTLPDGTVVRSADLIGETRKGRKFVFLGDTSDSNSMLEEAKDCDVIVHEATYDASLEEKAIEGGHSTR